MTMKRFQKISLFIFAIILSLGAIFLFFGGTWEGARFGLEIFGAVWIVQTTYSMLVKNQAEEQRDKEAKEIADKYFRAN